MIMTRRRDPQDSFVIQNPSRTIQGKFLQVPHSPAIHILPKSPFSPAQTLNCDNCSVFSACMRIRTVLQTHCSLSQRGREPPEKGGEHKMLYRKSALLTCTSHQFFGRPSAEPQDSCGTGLPYETNTNTARIVNTKYV